MLSSKSQEGVKGKQNSIVFHFQQPAKLAVVRRHHRSASRIHCLSVTETSHFEMRSTLTKPPKRPPEERNEDDADSSYVPLLIEISSRISGGIMTTIRKRSITYNEQQLQHSKEQSK